MTKITQPRLLAGPARFNVFLQVSLNDCLLVKLDFILTVIIWGNTSEMDLLQNHTNS